MKRIVLQLLLSIALVCQGIAGVFAATVPQAMHGCCPHGQLDATHLKCPCPQKQSCTLDCQFQCATSAVCLIGATPIRIEPVKVHAVQRAGNSESLHVLASNPPIRPPIV